jgi:hypothetical protein
MLETQVQAEARQPGQVAQALRAIELSRGSLRPQQDLSGFLQTLAELLPFSMASPRRLSFIELFLHQRGDRGSLFRTGVMQARDDADDVGDRMILVEFEFHLY